MKVETKKQQTIQENVSKLLKSKDTEQFIKQAKQYIKAINQNKMFCIIKSVSSSGMSRQIAFFSTEQNKNTHRFYQSNYRFLFDKLGYKESKNNWGYYTINGCGMDMIFHTNYSIIRKLHSLGFISKKQCEKLVQQTPTTL